MNQPSDLEIRIDRRADGDYGLDLRWTPPDTDAEVHLRCGQVQFDLGELLRLSQDPLGYGKSLARQLFADSDVKAAFAQARAVAQAKDYTLRVRLLIERDASDLHKLHWEALCDPVSDSSLFIGERLLFSRYLASPDWRPVETPARPELKVLLLIANPQDLAEYGLKPVDIAAELRVLRPALEEIQITILPDGVNRAGLPALMEALHKKDYSLVYVVAHGLLNRGESWLFLENETGQVARVSGAEISQRFRELTHLPRLVVLASCQSAAVDSAGALAPIGPRLAEAGVPAVVAMQGLISQQTLSMFMPVFFRQLREEGQIDLAMALARGEVRSRPDYWMPVLYMRIKSGRLWYTPGFAGGQSDFAFDSLKTSIEEGQCTPIIGPGLVAPLIGTYDDLAVRWAEKYNYPLKPGDKNVLARVAQYILVRHDPLYLRQALNDFIGEEIIQHYGSIMPADMAQLKHWPPKKVLEAIELIASQTDQDLLTESYHQIASLRQSIYITANPGDLLSRALKQVDPTIDPQVRLCPWNKDIPQHLCIYEDQPTPEKPLIFHLYGHLNTPESLVLTEDDFLDYLMGIIDNKELIPPAVRGALVNTALLFVGFQMDDWYFRVLFRFLMMQSGQKQRLFRRHAAAQIVPDENRILNLERAQSFLEQFFETGKISIFWGTTPEFLQALAAYRQV